MELYKQNITSATPNDTVIGIRNGIQILSTLTRNPNSYAVEPETGTVHVELSKGYYGLVHVSEWAWMRNLHWISSKQGKSVYMVAGVKLGNGKWTMISAHRAIEAGKVPDGRKSLTVIDHKDFNGLNNLPENLRVKTRVQNSHNRRGPNGNNKKTGVQNVYQMTAKRFRVAIMVEGKYFFWDKFRSLEDAVLFRDRVMPQILKSMGGN